MTQKNTLGDLDKYIKRVKLQNPKIKIRDQNIIIINRLINFNIISNLIFIVLIGVFLRQNLSNLYGVLGIFFFIIFLFFLWLVYNTINIVIINLELKNISIFSRNIFKKIFQKKVVIKIEEIKKCYITSSGFGRGQSRYKLKVKTKENKIFGLTDFSQQDEAERIRKFFENFF